MDEGQPALANQPCRIFLGRIEVLAVQQNLGAEVARVHHFHVRRETRHDDHRRHAKTLRMIGNALRMISGRYRNHATLARGGIQRQQPVESTPLLERGGELLVLELQVQLRPGNIGKRTREQARSLDNITCNRLRRGADVFQSN